jgi:hypothetical protein
MRESVIFLKCREFKNEVGEIFWIIWSGKERLSGTAYPAGCM